MGVNPEEVVQDDVMDCEWKRGGRSGLNDLKEICLWVVKSRRVVLVEVNGLGGVVPGGQRLRLE